MTMPSVRISRAIALGIAFVLLAALLVISEIAQNGQKQINRLISASQDRQVQLAHLLEQIARAEAGQRGFLLTNDAHYLQPYLAVRDRIEPTLDQFTNGFIDGDQLYATPEQREVLRHLRVLVGAKLAELEASLALYQSQGPEQALALVRTDMGSQTMSDIRAAAMTLREAERQTVQREIVRAERLRLVSRALMSGVALVNVCLLVFASMLLARQARRRAELTAQLATENEELERRVQNRTAELSALSNHLQQLTEKEKASLARELHDELGGVLIAVKMDVAWLQKRASVGEPEIEARWKRLLELLDEGVDVKRRIVENLRPTLLDNMGLLPAVRWITQETCQHAGLQYVESYPDEELLLTDAAAIMVFRLVQESLTNIVKHAHASAVRVEIAIEQSELVLIIEDDGVGIEPRRRDAIGSHGLATMRHRVRSFGGNLQIDSPAAGGTRVRALLPLARILPPERANPPEPELGAAANL
jgi:signal transduction histidine kinase